MLWNITFSQDDSGVVEDLIVTSADPILFQPTLCSIRPENRVYSFMESSMVETALLDQQMMFLSAADRGRTKDVYGVSYLTGLAFIMGPAH